MSRVALVLAGVGVAFALGLAIARSASFAAFACIGGLTALLLVAFAIGVHGAGSFVAAPLLVMPPVLMIEYVARPVQIMVDKSAGWGIENRIDVPSAGVLTGAYCA